MEARQVNAGQGWTWITDGFELFRKSPIIWIVLFIILASIFLVSLFVPLIGPLIFNLLLPTFVAGLMVGCRALEQGEELELVHLFAGFRKNLNQLITVGGVNLVGQIAIVGVIMVFGGSALFTLFMGGKQSDPETLVAAMRTMGLAMLVGMALFVPLLMVLWFAPLLVIFDDMRAAAAMKLSFNACLKNLLPFLVYGVIAFVLWMIASIPLGLGLLVLMPVLVASVYVSYKDIFVAQLQDRAPQPGT